MGRRCHHCGTELDSGFTVGRRDTCAKCGWDLRCCLNCAHYAPGYHNDCRENQAERQVDKAAGNFCDFFTYRSGGTSPTAPTAAARSELEKLFKK